MNTQPVAPVSLDSPEAYLGQVMFITGPEKHCGKTTFMNRAMLLARRGAANAGRLPPAVMTVGYDGEARDFLTGVRKPAVPVQAGDVFVTAERFLRPSGSCPEILDVAPGVGSLGRLCIARANRDGLVALVGPEGNKTVAWILEALVAGGLADSVLVDGAINRITQAASRTAARFVYVLRVDRAGLHRAVDRVRRIGALIALPLVSGGTQDKNTLRIEGALTAETAARIPPKTQLVVVDDFTKIFLTLSELTAFTREHGLAVTRQICFAGFVVTCRGLSDEEFIRSLNDTELSALVCFNSYRVDSNRIGELKPAIDGLVRGPGHKIGSGGARVSGCGQANTLGQDTASSRGQANTLGQGIAFSRGQVSEGEIL